MGLTLTEAATARLAGLVRDSAPAGSTRVFDGELVAGPRFEAAPSGKGVITGLDEQTARGIAGRLSH